MTEFKAWIDAVPIGTYTSIKRDIINQCGISEFVFRNWRNARTEVPYLAKKAINEIAREYDLPKAFEI